jgi:hypothetical protein
MATNITSYGSLLGSTTSTGTLIINGNSNISSGYSWIDKNKDIEDFVEFGLQIMGIDLTYDKFIKMNKLERKTFIRDYRLEKLLKNNKE